MNQVSAQQPQNSISMPQNSNSDEIDQGCFKWYRIILYIYLVLGVLNIPYTIYLLIHYSSLGGYYIFAIFFQSFLLFYVAIQLQAIQQRDLGKAALALIGFVIYLVMCPLFSFGFSLVTLGYVDPDVVSNFAVSLVSFIVFVLIGSIKVYQSLKKSQAQSDGYRSIDNATRNNASV